MKKHNIVGTVGAALLALGVSLAGAADTAKPSEKNEPGFNVPSNPQSEVTSPTQAPSGTWTNLKGTVESVDVNAKTLQLKDETGKVLQIPVDRQVSIEKNGKPVNLSQVQTGDTIILARKTGSSSEPKTY
jgi:hypothetical protein